jgi:hypothetical protein
MRLDQISTHRASVSELPRRVHLHELKKIDAEYLAHFKAFAAWSPESSDISYELQALKGKHSRAATARHARLKERQTQKTVF